MDNRYPLRNPALWLNDAEAGSSLLEVAISLALILAILIGVMASLTTAAVAQMNATESTQSQALLSQTLEEIKANDYDDLLSFNGQSVTSGTNTALIQADLVATNLTRIQITVTSSAYADVITRTILLIARTD